MDNIINFITNGSTDFSPQVVVGLIVFCLILESIGAIVYNILKISR